MKTQLIFRQLFDEATWTYTYILGDPKTREAIIIDPVIEKAERDLEVLKELGLNLKYSLETHVHADHVTAGSKLRELTGVKTVLGKNTKVPCADILIDHNETLTFGDYEIKALYTPGHTDGCMSYVVEDRVFTGDALFIRSNGRTDFQSGSSERLYESIQQQLYSLPDNTFVYPGHDYRGLTVSTIDEEKKFNKRITAGTSKEEFIKTMSELKLADPKRIKEAVPANMKCGSTEERKMRMEA